MICIAARANISLNCVFTSIYLSICLSIYPTIWKEVHTLSYICNQGRIQDFAQGGTKRAQSAQKFFCPPPELLRGGTGGDRIQDEGGKFCTILRFCTIY